MLLASQISLDTLENFRSVQWQPILDTSHALAELPLYYVVDWLWRRPEV